MRVKNLVTGCEFFTAVPLKETRAAAVYDATDSTSQSSIKHLNHILDDQPLTNAKFSGNLALVLNQ